MKSFLKISIKKASIKKSKNTSLFTIINDNMDVRINKDIKGKWKNFTFSQLIDDPEGRRLLSWISEQNFNPRVVEIAKEVLEA